MYYISMTWLYHGYDKAVVLFHHGFTLILAALDHACNMTASSPSSSMNQNALLQHMAVAVIDKSILPGTSKKERSSKR